jgi:hypothetical protein
MSLEEYFAEYIRRHRSALGPENPDNYVGVWSDENRQFTTDISENLQDRSEAMRRGGLYMQSAVFDLDTGNPIGLPEHDHP